AQSLAGERLGRGRRLRLRHGGPSLVEREPREGQVAVGLPQRLAQLLPRRERLLVPLARALQVALRRQRLAEREERGGGVAGRVALLQDGQRMLVAGARSR